ncbi:MAG: molybdopterin molybdotransferase MoeA [Thermomicrobiales bacterium]|nr:molybdopterin molybdotransferase MoeA [Thermomicrobiales bacterium]
MTDLDRMRHPAEALELVVAHSAPLPVEQIPLRACAGRVLAADVTAPENHPPFPASTMDGFAVNSEDVSPWREIVGVQNAGPVLDLEVTPGMAVRIMTGAPLPPGADAVVRIENTELADDHVIINQDVINSGDNIRPIGSDIAAGATVLETGVFLGPSEIGLLASLGIDPVSVYRKPRVAVISTGDELVEPDQPLAPGMIRDSNRFSLLAALGQLPVDVVWAGKGPDDRVHLETLLRERIADCDVVLTTGGVSMGDLDLIKAILGDLADVHFRRVFMKPGKPLNFATSGQTLLFGLPGNPVSALVGFELFVRPALRILGGHQEAVRPRLLVHLAHDIEPTDRIDHQRAWIAQNDAGQLVASTTGAQGSSRLASFTGSNGLVIVPPRDRRYVAGEAVEGILLGDLARIP